MKITRETIIADIANMHTDARKILEERGMFCLDCETSKTENLEHAALVHACDVDELADELNKALELY